MRCLFLVDELARFREVAAALDARQVTMVLLKNSWLAEQVLQKARFQIVVVAANAFTSEGMKFLHRLRNRPWPVLAVTGELGLRQMLLDLGAERVVVLPDHGAKLQFALETLLKQSAA